MIAMCPDCSQFINTEFGYHDCAGKAPDLSSLQLLRTDSVLARVVEISPEAVEQIAQRVVELLKKEA